MVCCRISSWTSAAIDLGRQTTRAVAGVHAGPFDVFHDPADHDLIAVGQSIDIDFDGIIEKFIHQHRVLRRCRYRIGHVAPQRLAIINDLHCPPAEHVGGPNQHRIAQTLRQS